MKRRRSGLGDLDLARSFGGWLWCPRDQRLFLESIMTLPSTALPVELPPAFLGVTRSLTGKLWRDRLDARGAARALAIAQRYQLP